jgi:hypothetical protein
MSTQFAIIWTLLVWSVIFIVAVSLYVNALRDPTRRRTRHRVRRGHVSTYARGQHYIRRHNARHLGVWPDQEVTLLDTHGYVGRRRVDHPARTPVHRGWVPVIGNARIALLETNTSEYMIVKRPRHNHGIGRGYVHGGLEVSRG